MLTNERSKSRALFLSAIGAASLALLANACSDDAGASPPASATDGGPTQEQEAGTLPAPDGGGEGKVTVANITSFDATQFELPEALSYKDGFAYVSLAPRATIERIAIDTGARTTYATLPLEASNLVLGSIFDAAGNLFVGVGATNPADAAGVAKAGIYKIPPGAGGAGGTPVLFASSPTSLKFGNGLALAANGDLFVSDAADGAVYKIPPAGAVGTATPWKSDPALTGDMDACPGTVAGFPLGANGIVVDDDGVYVGVTDRGSLVKIAINGDGSAGAVSVIVSDCARLEGLDGLRPDPASPKTAFLGTNNPKNTLVRVTRTGTIEVLHQASPPELDGPADLVHVTGKANPYELLVVNSAFPEAFAPPELGLVPRPSLVKVTLP